MPAFYTIHQNNKGLSFIIPWKSFAQFILATAFGYLLSFWAYWVGLLYLVPTFIFITGFFGSVEKDRNSYLVLVILLSILGLIDFNQGWLGSLFVMGLFGKKVALTVTGIWPATLLITSLIYLLFGRKLYSRIEPNNPNVTDENRNAEFKGQCLVIWFGMYFVAKMLIGMAHLIPQYDPGDHLHGIFA